MKKPMLLSAILAMIPSAALAGGDIDQAISRFSLKIVGLGSLILAVCILYAASHKKRRSGKLFLIMATKWVPQRSMSITINGSIWRES
jgi:hypothetical protein